MNAAQTSHLSKFPVTRSERAQNQNSTTAPAAAKSKALKPKNPSRAAKKRASKVSASVNELLRCECLQQAEICREQAQEAARMKRFKAARGLFATAIALCQSALSACAARNKERAADAASANATENCEDTILTADDAAIQDYLQQLNIEMATYSDLARSMERPLRS